MRKLWFLLLFLIPWSLRAQTGWSGGSGVYADSARAASIADSAKHVPGVGQTQELMADRLVTYTTNADTFSVYAGLNVYPLGKALYLDDGTQYAYHADMDALDIETDDFMLITMVKCDTSGGAARGIMSKRWGGSTSYYTLRISPANYYSIELHDGATYIGDDFYESDGLAHFISVVIDFGSYMYYFVDGRFIGTKNISTLGGINNVANFCIGNEPSAEREVVVSSARVFRFGQNGFYVTGTGDTDLEVRVGSASGTLIYSEKYPYSPDHPGGLIPDMYRNPGRRLSELGYGELENADRTDLVTNGDFESGSVSPWTTGGDGTATLDTSTSFVHSGVYSAELNVTTASKWALQSVSFTHGGYYELKMFVYNPSSGGFTNYHLEVWDNVNGLSLSSNYTTKDSWVECSLIAKVADTATQLKIYIVPASGETGEIYFDDVTFKRIGEVAYWPMNESGTPTTLADLTDNNLDLTTVGSPSMVYTTWDKLSMDRIYADTLEADSANMRVINAARHYVTNGDVPGTGSTTPMIYANGGEIYAHDAFGNNTLISPHFGGDWVFNSFNSETGVRTFIDMIDLVKAMEAMTGKKFMYSDTLLAPATIEEAADTVYVVVVDTVKHTRTLVQYLRPKRGYRLIGGKAYRFLRDKAHRPPDGWYKRHGLTPPASGRAWRQP